MLDFLRAVIALLLIFFLPGFFLVQAIFPRKRELDKDFDLLYRGALGIGLSIVITILLGFVLNAFGVNPETQMGYFSSTYIALGLILLTLLFFFIGWWRGAYLFMGKWHPALIRLPPRDPRSLVGIVIRDKKNAFKHQMLAEGKFRILDEIEYLEKNEESHTGEKESYYREKRLKLQKELKELELEMIGIEQTEVIG